MARPAAPRIPSRYTAWALVRGYPSRMKPGAQSGRASRSFTMALVMSSVTSPPESMMAWICFPSSVPRAL
jgi:hypothetical protein